MIAVNTKNAKANYHLMKNMMILFRMKNLLITFKAIWMEYFLVNLHLKKDQMDHVGNFKLIP